MSEFDRRDAMTLGLAAAATAFLGDSALAQLQEEPTYFHGVEGLTIPEEITVIGTGGFGSWPALFAALSGVKSMLLIDASDITIDDLGRTPFREGDIGKSKVQALTEIIHFFRPEVKVSGGKRFVEAADDDIYFGTVLFNGTDYPPLCEKLPLEAEKRGMKYRHGFYRGQKAGTVDHHVTGIEYSRGSQVPIWPGVAALSGLLATYSAFVRPLNFYGEPDVLNQASDIIAMNVSDRPAP